MPLEPGSPFPLGAHLTDGGVRFAVASGVAESVEVCLIDPVPGSGDDDDLLWGTERRVRLTARTYGVWHGVIPGVRAGQRYGYRVHGPWSPAAGLWCNPNKLLVDPYAAQIDGGRSDLDAACAYEGDPMFGPPSVVDSLGQVPLSVVTEPLAPITGPRLNTPWSETVIYELHVRGYTELHPAVPAALRGTYPGLAHPAVIDHLRFLGITAVELLPVHAFVTEPAIARAGRVNYWGYSTLSFLAPHPAYATEPGRERHEFRAMVEALHEAGIEVLLDVVFNHTCEGGADGVSLSFRGLDGPGYYARNDITGCGNTLDAGSPTVVRLVLDSLRHWVLEYGVDGFRFDLASVLGRPRAGHFDRHAGLLTAIATDPVLCQVKLIAEPWDATGEGYQVGNFGIQWAEWNGRYRDTVRDFWRGATDIRDLAYRVTGSSDLFADGGRRPWQSINFITAHDGFTLRDLVSYNHKHNEANGERNRDGTDDNRSYNHGVEGETDDPDISALRLRQARNLLATLILSSGTPMITAGDEMWRTQHGNNNAYCLDNETSWLDWTPDGIEPIELLTFARHLLAIRRDCPALRKPDFFLGHDTYPDPPDLIWFGTDGEELSEIDWFDENRRTLIAWIDGATCSNVHSWLLILHADPTPVTITLPPPDYSPAYITVLDTDSPIGEPDPTPLPAAGTLTIPPRTTLLLRANTHPERSPD